MTDLPPIPRDDWQRHQQETFDARADAVEQHFAAHEQGRALEAQARDRWYATGQAIEQDFLGRQAQQAQQTLNATADRIEQDFLSRTAAPPAAPPRLPSAGDVVGAVGRAIGSVVPTTVDLGQGKTAGRDTNEADALARVYADARAQGLDDAGARAAVAVAKTEGGYGGAQGDRDIGGSRGTFQFYFGGGQGNAFAKALGVSEAEADRILAADPHAGNRFALSGYLGNAIREGQRRGLTGADLATFAQQHGQVSVSPERAGANYQALFGPGAAGETAQDAQQTPSPPTRPSLGRMQTPDMGLPEETDGSRANQADFQGQIEPFEPAAGRYLPENAQPLATGPTGLAGPPSQIDHRARVQQAVSGLADALIGMVGGAGEAANAVGVGLQGAVSSVPGGEFVTDYLQEQGRTNLENQRLLRLRPEAMTPDELEQRNQALVDLAGPSTLVGAIENVGAKAAAPAVEGLVGPTGRAIRATAGDVTPILDAAGEEIKRIAVKLPTPIKTEFLQPEAAMPKRSVALGRLIVDRVRNVIGSMGDAGQELAQRIQQIREGAEPEAQALIDRMPTVDRLSKPDFAHMVDVLEGNASPRSPVIAQAAQEAKGVLDDVFSRATNAGVDVADRIENYFPHRYKDEVLRDRLETARRGELIRRLMESGKAADEGEAAGIVHRWMQGSLRDRRQGSLEMARLANLPGYEKTKEALYDHIVTAMNRTHEVAQLGRNDAIANKLIDRMAAEGWPLPLVQDLYQTAVGAHTYGQALQDFSRVTRAWHTATRLGLAAISNATQLANTASAVGIVRTLEAAKGAAFTPAERQFARSTAVTLDSIIKEVREGAGFADKVIPKLPGPVGRLAAKVSPDMLMAGFNEVEKANRTVTAIAGRDFARDMAARAAGTATGLNRIGSKAGAMRALKKMGLDAEGIVARGGKLTPQEEIKAARNIVERTQFRVDPQDIPEWASHPLGKMAFQFKAFSYGQSAYVLREILGELAKGNPLPLVRFAVLAPLAQMAATETRNVLQGRPPEEDQQTRLIQYALGPMGFAGDVSRTLLGINSKYVPTERRVAQFTGSVLGPTVGTLTEGLGAGINATQGNLVPAARLGLRQVPYAGGYLANALTPYNTAAAPAETRPSSTRSGTRSGTRSSGTRSGGRR